MMNSFGLVSLLRQGKLTIQSSVTLKVPHVRLDGCEFFFCPIVNADIDVGEAFISATEGQRVDLDFDTGRVREAVGYVFSLVSLGQVLEILQGGLLLGKFVAGLDEMHLEFLFDLDECLGEFCAKSMWMIQGNKTVLVGVKQFHYFFSRVLVEFLPILPLKVLTAMF
jgi:hypothetical protein